MAEKDLGQFPTAETEQIQSDTVHYEAQEADPLLSADQVVRPKRSSKPTIKAAENYHTMKDELCEHLEEQWERVTYYMSRLESSSGDAACLQAALERLNTAHERYKRLSTRYITFLKDSKIDEALSDLSKAEEVDKERDAKVQDAIDKAEHRIPHQQETRSHRSTSSRRSSRSSSSRSSALSDRILEARIRAEESKVRRSFTEREVEEEAKRTEAEALAKAEAAKAEALAKAEAAKAEAHAKAEAAKAEAKRAEAEARIKIIRSQMEEEVALAKVRLLEQALIQGPDPADSPPLEADNPVDRTRDYVLNQLPVATPVCSTVQADNTETSNLPLPVSVPPKAPEQINNSHQEVPSQTQPPQQDGNQVFPDPLPQLKQRSSESTEAKPQLNPAATSFYPGTSHPFMPGSPYAPGASRVVVATSGEKSDMSEFARFMVSRELINTSLTNFDDRAESYRAWKATFKAAIANLNFTAEQELDLLIKWLGPGFTNRIKSLRTVYVGQAEAGLAAAWQRLERTFGSAEAIEKALFKRLQDIPKINLKEVHKLQDLSDLLMELELAKRDPRLSGLCYLDTAHGVNPIVVKLPYSLQEKWATSVSRYKRMNDVTFPPFIQFCKFIDEQAQMRNDPSLDFLEFNTSAAATSSSSRYEGAIHKRRDIKNTVSVRKTELPSPAAPTDKQYTISSRDKPFNQECPIHKKPHSLNKCRGFRSKTLQERKKVLTELGICFKCCASLEHMAKDCKSIVKCEECHSEKHVSAMHPTQLARDTPAAVTTTPTPSHGGEPKNQTDTTTAVSCSCSEVCGEGQTQKCCARICLIKVYPEGHPEKAMKVYAIIDDQSNRSLAGTKFFEAFGINGPSEPYTFNTCSGRIETSGRRAQGFIASPINGKTEIPLPTLVECDQIPSHRNEIPTPEAAFHQPHLRHLASVIPPLDNNAEILLLLGRDNLRVHKVRQQCNGPDYAPYAQRLDLGWVVIGNVCVDRSEIDSFKTYVHGDGRTTCLKPCPHHYEVKEKSPDTIQLPDIASSLHIDNFGRSVFLTTKDDDKVALSVEDREFIGIMDCEFSKDKTNHWVSPLPF
ncbi:uncharacterized protein ACNLHF_005218 isoform 1-T2 [Anomaloglossus baeobatrachus]